MTNQQDTALLPVEQSDREAAADYLRHCNKIILRSAARHRLQSLEQPKPSGERAGEVERVTQAIADAQFGGSFNGLEWPEAWDHFETLARAAIAALSERGAGTPDHPLRANAPEAQRYRHKKRGTVYEIIGAAELQMSCDMLVDGSSMVVYRGEDGRLWVREESEFYDGRFECMGGKG